MKYSCYPSSAKANRVRLQIFDSEIQELQLSSANCLKAQFIPGPRLLFTRDTNGPLSCVYSGANGKGVPILIFEGSVQLKLPKCGTIPTEYETDPDNDGFSIPKLAYPTSSRTYKGRRTVNTKAYTFQDLQAACDLLTEISRMLNIQLRMNDDGTFYIPLSTPANGKK